MRHACERHACEIGPSERHACETPIRDARLWEMYAYEIAVYGIYTP